MTRRSAAKRFGVTASTTNKWVHQWERTGDVEPRRQDGDHRSHKLEAHAEEILGLIKRGVTSPWRRSAAIPGFGLISGSSDDTAFGMQVGGVVALSVARRIEATLDYRYLFTSGLDLDGLEADYDNHSVRVGLRFRL